MHLFCHESGCPRELTLVQMLTWQCPVEFIRRIRIFKYFVYSTGSISYSSLANTNHAIVLNVSMGKLGNIVTCWGKFALFVLSSNQINKIVDRVEIHLKMFEELEHVFIMKLFRLSIEYAEQFVGPRNARVLRRCLQPFFHATDIHTMVATKRLNFDSWDPTISPK